MKDTRILGLTAIVSTTLSIGLLIGMLYATGIITVINPNPNDPGQRPSTNSDEGWSNWGPAGTTIRNAHGWNDWADSGSASFKSVSDGQGGYYANYRDDYGEQIVPTRSVASHYMVDGDFVEVSIYSISSPSVGNINFFTYSGSSMVNQICLSDREIMVYDNGAWKYVYVGTTVGHWINIRITCTGVSTWGIAYSYDGGLYSSSSGYENIGAISYNDNPIDHVGFNSFYGSAGEYWIRSIDVSWE